MKNLSEKELVEINGGEPEETYKQFHAAGKAIHDWVVDTWNNLFG